MGNNMRAERVRNNITRQELGEMLGVHPNAIYRWEKGETEPSSSNLVALCKIYKCSPEYLLDMTDDRNATAVAD